MRAKSQNNLYFAPYYWDEEIIRTSVSNHQRHNIEHPAPFPINLPIVPILQTTDEGDLVLDPFCESGTTGKVSNSIGRRFVGMDVVFWYGECINEKVENNKENNS